VAATLVPASLTPLSPSLHAEFATRNNPTATTSTKRIDHLLGLSSNDTADLVMQLKCPSQPAYVLSKSHAHVESSHPSCRANSTILDRNRVHADALTACVGCAVDCVPFSFKAVRIM